MPTGASSSGGATIMGTVNSSASASGAGDVRAMAGGAGITVAVVQTGQSTMTDGSGRFVLTGVPSGTVTLHFTAAGIDAQLQITGLQVGQTLTITVHVSGSHADLGNGDHPSDPAHSTCFTSGAKAEVEGVISTKAASSITVSQQGKGDYDCLVSASTRIRKGNRSLTLEDLAVGSRVHVSGTGLGIVGGVCEVDASEIKLQ